MRFMWAHEKKSTAIAGVVVHNGLVKKPTQADN